MEAMESRYGPFWSYLNEDGEIRDEIRDDLREVLGLIADVGIVFDAGHASAKESLDLVKEVEEAGIEKIVVDHPLSITKQATIEQQKEVVRHGAYIEQPWGKMQPTGAGVNLEKYVEAITAVVPRTWS